MKHLLAFLGLFFLFLPAAHSQGYPQNYELLCPAGSTPISGPTGVSVNPTTGKFRANYCIDATGNIYENITGGGTHSGTETFTGPIVSTNAGVFTNTQANLYNQFNLGGINPATEWSFLFGTNLETEALSGGCAVPSGATNFECNAIAGYANTSKQATAAVGVFGSSRGLVTNAQVLGGNFIGSDNAGFASSTVYGVEGDCNAFNIATICHGILINGFFSSQITNGQGIEIAKPTGNGGINVWPEGIRLDVGATLPATVANLNATGLGIDFYPASTGVNQASQGLGFVANDPVSGANSASLGERADGNLLIQTSKAATGLIAPMLTAGPATCTGTTTGDGCFNRSATTGDVNFGSDGNVYLFRSAVSTMQLGGASFVPSGGFDIGSTSLPWANLWLGTAATNNFKFQPAATTAARTVALPDPGTNVNLAFNLSATSAAFATATTAGTCVQNTTVVTGATTSMVATASPVSTPGTGAVWSAFVSSAGNVTINECAVATSAGGTIAFNIRVTP